MSCKLTVCFLFSGYLLFYALINVKDFYKKVEECLFVDGDTGGCVTLAECPSFIRAIHEARSAEDREVVWRNLERSACRSNTRMSKFCCPGVTPNVFSTTPPTLNESATEAAAKSPSSTNSVTESTPPLAAPKLSAPETVSNASPTTEQEASSELLEPKDAASHQKLDLLPQTDCGLYTPQAHNNLDYEFPWVVHVSALFHFPTGGVFTTCRGTLINDLYVLTSASCMVLKDKQKPILVKVRMRQTYYDVEEYVPHKLFRPKGILHDIALIRLKEKIVFEDAHVSPICLPIDPRLHDPQYELAAGYFSMELNCEKGDTGSEVFAPCELDGTTRYVQFGVANFWPKNCDDKTQPVVLYTRMEWNMEWILDNIKP